MTKQFGKERFEQCKRLINLGAVTLPTAEAREFVCHKGRVTSIGVHIADAASPSTKLHDELQATAGWSTQVQATNLFPTIG